MKSCPSLPPDEEQGSATAEALPGRAAEPVVSEWYPIPVLGSILPSVPMSRCVGCQQETPLGMLHVPLCPLPHQAEWGKVG